MDLVRNTVGWNLLDGCCYEAERAERVAGSLDQLRQHLPPEMHAHLAGLINQILSTSYNLRDITDHSQVHMARVPWATDHLNVLLPCLTRTLKDIESYYSNQAESREKRWRRMYQEMSEEIRGTPLPARFVLYNDYLNQLRFLLGRSPNFDPNALINMQRRILDLRRARDIHLVLFYNTFICLKLRSPRMLDFHPKELIMREELTMFTAYVEEDDKSLFTLSIHRDIETKRRRLQMTLCEGHLSNCPIWTAFLPRTGEMPRNQWLRHGKSEHIILIKHLQPYVFCDGYSVPSTKSNADTHKIYFVSPLDADKFLTYF
ncbi:hypothetical protein E8E14_007799 [Neopestalotiopsis sp. 37M]|nr:hypothetical protein E8E14_007799 [Neopestalotiopsis sp. 37M]